jgi:hypothetical protein
MRGGDGEAYIVGESERGFLGTIDQGSTEYSLHR